MILYSEKRKQKGFTLLEVLFALSILAIGLLATAAMQGVAMKSNYVANRISVANMIGQQVLEELHSRPITDSELLNSVGPLPYDFIRTTPLVVDNIITIPGAGRYSATYRTWTNWPVGIATQGTTRIQVTVTYLDPTNDMPMQMRTFETFKMVM